MTGDDLWVFGYGSLVWDPGFAHEERVVATVAGYARSFCMRSIHHRGSVERPGLVLALDERDAGTCQGIAFRVSPGRHDETIAYLRERELISSAYLERELDIALADGRAVRAVGYVIDPDHEQYCGGLALDEQARIIAAAIGGRGPNTEYLFNTARHLAELGIGDDELDWLSAEVARLGAVDC